MSRYKFRAWDLGRKKYYPLDGTDDLGIFDDDNFDIEQWTGLKDKNGREIYEGDIYKIACAGGLLLEQVAWDDDGVGFVRMDLRGFNVPRLSGGLPAGDSIEVIGNIHENPELLTPR